MSLDIVSGGSIMKEIESLFEIRWQQAGLSSHSP